MTKETRKGCTWCSSFASFILLRVYDGKPLPACRKCHAVACGMLACWPIYVRTRIRLSAGETD
jgi:hypothetical protein